MLWAKENSVEFHVTGSKGPTFLAYLKKSHTYPVEFESLKLGSYPIKRICADKVLVLIRKVRKNNTAAWLTDMVMNVNGI